MEGMSFKEFLELTLNIDFPKFTLEEIITNHENIAFDIVTKLQSLDKKKLVLFKRS